MKKNLGVTSREILRHELDSRIGRNPKYSLRSFAILLTISSSFLSQILSGKRNLTLHRAQSFMPKLDWTSIRKKQFLLLVQMENTVDPDIFAELLTQYQKIDNGFHFEVLQNDVTIAISQWYHAAIMELTEIKEFDETPTWVAKRLGISPISAELAIDRLKRLGLLVIREKKLVKSSPNFSTADVPSTAIKNFHLSHLALASKAIVNQDFEKRDFSGITIAINEDKIPLLKEKIFQLQEDIGREIEGDSPNVIYHLSTQLYRLDQ
jgi:uncharacterized protein (TIGR02147 family)